ncbi:hypothetical protein LOAG_08752 [Loa loa]|uniref:Uncharacterized protein n=1 Tax=Loa loa TaxID=7209 RepID=A0A1S0TT60_LOALO|nr:hypothetical protein LOAG_08752 [Loa loa]EFO19737.1 hypothetical protein LOAG_08752 [Loa loa]
MKRLRPARTLQHSHTTRAMTYRNGHNGISACMNRQADGYTNQCEPLGRRATGMHNGSLPCKGTLAHIHMHAYIYTHIHTHAHTHTCACVYDHYPNKRLTTTTVIFFTGITAINATFTTTITNIFASFPPIHKCYVLLPNSTNGMYEMKTILREKKGEDMSDCS